MPSRDDGETFRHTQVFDALDHISTGLMVQDAYGEILFANRAYLDLQRESDFPRLPHHHATVWRHSSGQWLMARQTPIDGVGTVTTFTDVTELKVVEEKLRQAKIQAESIARGRCEFLTNVSHELRTPLNAIIGFSEAILNGLLGPLSAARFEEYAQDILYSGQHLLSLINDILDLSKIEAGAMTVDHHPIALSGIVERALKMTRDSARTNGLALEAEVPPDLPPVTGDERRLLQVLLNLLSNAVKFTPEGGTVTIAAEADDKTVTVHVVDSGIGIAAADIPRVLEAFEQIDSPFSRRFPGSGLGLPLSRRLVELHGGTLSIDSQPNQGTTIRVRLPRAEA